MDVDKMVDFDSQSTLSYVTKGHVVPAEFCKEIEAEYGDVLDPKNVQHVLARKVPENKYSEFPGCWVLHIVTNKRRGVFPATYIEL